MKKALLLFFHIFIGSLLFAHAVCAEGPSVEITRSKNGYVKDSSITITATVKEIGAGLLNPCIGFSKGLGVIEWVDADITDIGGTAAYIVSSNGIYNIYITDANNVTVKTEENVQEFDRTPPIGTIKLSSNAPTKEKIKAIIDAEDPDSPGTDVTSGLADLPYKWEGCGTDTGWCDKDEVLLSENGTLCCTIRDKAGNEYKTEKTVDLIDNRPPTCDVVYSPTGWTNTNVTVALEDADDNVHLTDKPFYFHVTCLDGSSFNATDSVLDRWTSNNKVVLQQNGIVEYKLMDEAGNVKKGSVTIDFIDKVSPVLDSVTYNSKEWSNSNVTITISGHDEDETVEYAKSGLDEDAYRVPTAFSRSWTGSSTEVTENGEFVAQVRDKAGNITEKKIFIMQIDHDAPSIKCTNMPTEWDGSSVKLKFDVEDLKGPSGGVSGLPAKAYYGTKSGMMVNDGDYTSDKTMTIENEGQYKFVARDNAGNVAEFRFDMIKTAKEVIVGSTYNPYTIRKKANLEPNEYKKNHYDVEDMDIVINWNKKDGIWFEDENGQIRHIDDIEIPTSFANGEEIVIEYPDEKKAYIGCLNETVPGTRAAAEKKTSESSIFHTLPGRLSIPSIAFVILTSFLILGVIHGKRNH